MQVHCLVSLLTEHRLVCTRHLTLHQHKGDTVKIVINLEIDQDIRRDQVDEVFNKYIDELSKTKGDLTWDSCDYKIVFVASPAHEEQIARIGQ